MESEEIGQELEQVQQAVQSVALMNKAVRLVSFAPFKSAVHALENAMDVSEGVMNPFLGSFLEMNLPNASGKVFTLGVGEPTLAGSIKHSIHCECVVDDVVRELIRGIRLHATAFLSQLKDADVGRAQLGLGHAYSRAKVKFNVNRVDNMITQSIALLDQLDKDVNTFAMRVREWYGWHFPELVKIVSDNHSYARLCKLIKNKGRLGEDDLKSIEQITGCPIKARSILDAARASMGTDISDIDLLNIESFADRVIALHNYRAGLYDYLVKKMHAVAPNLSALIGEVVGARLISHAGSLTNLAKYPASTVQILGAEKALFRALKTRGNTPKYGLIFHSTFIGRASQKNKGRISRVLANKVSIACRIDCFIDKPTNKFGEFLREQVEERLRFYEDGVAPRKNSVVMAQALKEAGIDMDIDDDDEDEVAPKEAMTVDSPEKPTLKRPASEATDAMDVSPKKSKKKNKKNKTPAESSQVETTNTVQQNPHLAPSTMPVENVTDDKSTSNEKKKKKKKKSKAAEVPVA